MTSDEKDFALKPEDPDYFKIYGPGSTSGPPWEVKDYNTALDATNSALEDIKNHVAQAFVEEVTKLGTFTKANMDESVKGAFIKDYTIVVSIPIPTPQGEGTMDVTLKKRNKNG